MAYWQDELFGVTPESGSWQDIAQSLLNPVYDPEGNLIARILKEAPSPNMAEIGQNLQVDPMGDPNKAPPNPVKRDLEKEEKNRPSWKPSTNTFKSPDMVTMPIYTVPRREVGNIGGNANMYGRNKQDMTEEELANLIALLRGRA
tara:strand:- start:119 stop:553 length:435 start_codon:yes stop_codon:yes gene_type:complete